MTLSRAERRILLLTTLLGALVACALVFQEPRVAAAQSLDVVTMLYVSADRHGVEPALLDRIVRCESTYRWWVTGPDGSRGIAQFQDVTWAWASVDAGWSGYTPYHPEAAIDVMAWLLSRGEWWHWMARW